MYIGFEELSKSAELLKGRPILLVFIAIVYTLTACKNGLELEITSNPPHLVVNGVFTSDSLFQIEVSNSSNPGQSSQIRFLEDCDVRLWQNGKEVEDIESIFETKVVMVNGDPQDVVRHYYGTQTTVAREGVEYEIEVSHGDYEAVSANAFIPFPADIQWLNLTTNNEIIDMNGKAYRKLSFQLQNNVSQMGYFAIQALYGNANGSKERIKFYANDPIFSENQIFDEGDRTGGQGRIYDTNKGVFFSSEAFSGQQHVFDIFVETHYLHSNNVFELRVLTFSYELYAYSTSLLLQQSVSGNPFVEPVQVYSNIQKGYGIFSGYSISVLPFPH